MNKSLVYLCLVTAWASSMAFLPDALAQSNRSKQQARQKSLAVAKTPIPGMQASKTLPKNFPLPAYNRKVLKTSFVHSTKGSPTASALIITGDAPSTVFKWYYSVCKRDSWKMKVPGAQLKQTIAGSKAFYMMDAHKGHHSISLYCMKNPDPKQPGTRVNISWALR